MGITTLIIGLASFVVPFAILVIIALNEEFPKSANKKRKMKIAKKYQDRLSEYIDYKRNSNVRDRPGRYPTKEEWNKSEFANTVKDFYDNPSRCIRNMERDSEYDDFIKFAIENDSVASQMRIRELEEQLNISTAKSQLLNDEEKNPIADNENPAIENSSNVYQDYSFINSEPEQEQIVRMRRY